MLTSGNQDGISNFSRRKFINLSLRTAAAGALFTMPPIEVSAATRDYTVKEIIDLILKEVPGAPFGQTVDTLKSGNAEQQVTGIVTTMFATIDVIREAIRLNANFIIAHEPTYYNHTDDINWTGSNSVVRQKQELLKEHGIAVWRFHDYWHACRPDGVTYGVLKRAKWLNYNKNADIVFSIPSTMLKTIAEHLKKSLAIQHIRIIGTPDARCEKIALLPGAWGGQKQISTVEKEKPDVLVVGEVHEWETAEYIRDARSLGSKTSLIVLGHCQSEEPGMEWLVDWLQPKLDGVKVTHIPAKNPFVWA